MGDCAGMRWVSNADRSRPRPRPRLWMLLAGSLDRWMAGSLRHSSDLPYFSGFCRLRTLALRALGISAPFGLAGADGGETDNVEVRDVLVRIVPVPLLSVSWSLGHEGQTPPPPKKKKFILGELGKWET